MKKLHAYFFAGCLACCMLLCITVTEAAEWQDRVFYGGGGDLSISNQHTTVSISPLVGYRVTDKFWPGVSARYAYYRRDRSQSGGIPAFSTSIYGGSVFTRYLITRQLFATAEFELLNAETYNTVTNEFERTWMEGVLVGGGFRLGVGARSSAEIQLLVNLTEHEQYPYTNPQFRIGFIF